MFLQGKLDKSQKWVSFQLDGMSDIEQVSKTNLKPNKHALNLFDKLAQKGSTELEF